MFQMGNTTLIYYIFTKYYLLYIIYVIYISNLHSHLNGSFIYSIEDLHGRYNIKKT